MTSNRFFFFFFSFCLPLLPSCLTHSIASVILLLFLFSAAFSTTSQCVFSVFCKTHSFLILDSSVKENKPTHFELCLLCGGGASSVLHSFPELSNDGKRGIEEDTTRVVHNGSGHEGSDCLAEGEQIGCAFEWRQGRGRARQHGQVERI